MSDQLRTFLVLLETFEGAVSEYSFSAGQGEALSQEQHGIRG